MRKIAKIAGAFALSAFFGSAFIYLLAGSLALLGTPVVAGVGDDAYVVCTAITWLAGTPLAYECIA